MSSEFLFWLLAAHFIGDYLLQSHWMANEKSGSWAATYAHGFTYGIPFAILFVVALPLTPWMFLAWAIIVVTHMYIDHYRLAKHVGWLKNQIGPKKYRPSYKEAMDNFGYSASTPPFIGFWLMVITDNTMHIIINYLAVLLLFI